MLHCFGFAGGMPKHTVWILLVTHMQKIGLCDDLLLIVLMLKTLLIASSKGNTNRTNVFVATRGM